MVENLCLGFIGTLVLSGIIYFCVAINDAERTYWLKRKETINQENADCKANGGFVFTDSDGRKCLFTPGHHAN